jgi:hypothetical protein
MSYTLIERKELTEAASSISFENIPQFYSDLLVQISTRDTRGQIGNGINLFPNGSSSNLSSRNLTGTGSSVSSSTRTDGLIGVEPGSTTTSNTFSNISVYIPNYTASRFKSMSSDSVTENNATQAEQWLIASLWSSTDPITSITFQPSTADNFVAGSSISLYGINRQQAIGAPKAVGGAISFANGYWVHSFTGSGTFTAKENLDCEYIVIAGGGAGGNSGSGSGGGGAGGYRSSVFGELSGANSSGEARLSVSAQSSHLVQVGAGGTGTVVQQNGTPGNITSFSTITSIGGGFGATDATNGGVGGSGGGAGGVENMTGGAGTSGQGFAGGNSLTGSSSNRPNGGGGGAGAAGVNGTTNVSGNGGAGLMSSITGSSVFRAAGGGGGIGSSGSVAGNGGNGGGGQGSFDGVRAATAGQANTGSGGGGDYLLSGTGRGTGGSGIVIIRYKA